MQAILTELEYNDYLELKKREADKNDTVDRVHTVAHDFFSKIESAPDVSKETKRIAKELYARLEKAGVIRRTVTFAYPND